MKKSVRGLMTGLLTSTALYGFSSPLIASTAFADNQQGQPRIEVAFVLDTTGSMADLIDGAKRKIWSIANTIVDIHPDANIEMALIGYRDIGDDYVIKSYDMSPDIQGLYGNLVHFQANGGGDTPEAVNEALDASVRQLDWTEGEDTQRIVFLVGDAPPHMDYENAPKYPDVIKKARKEGIIVNAVQAGGDRETKKIWKEIAQLGNGRYIPIPQDGGQIKIIETPFDGDIIILQKRIDETVIAYGSEEEQSAVQDKMELKEAAPSSVQVENSKFYSKRSSVKEVITGGGDLVADIKNGAVTLETIEDGDLPKELQGKSDQEKQTYINAKLEERAQLEKSMSKLITKYDDYVAQKAKEQGKTDSFDQAVQETLKKQLY
ncbi:vWA domain-containing protein [Kiloniella majae]|uniref:vWA domain-containing protein n=1 Tax=Kiloniella majae TaxID=1938558 RepID=UPI000B499DFC|nr:vWA domain-containing protein [Kiloniella majae]